MHLHKTAGMRKGRRLDKETIFWALKLCALLPMPLTTDKIIVVLSSSETRLLFFFFWTFINKTRILDTPATEAVYANPVSLTIMTESLQVLNICSFDFVWSKSKWYIFVFIRETSWCLIFFPKTLYAIQVTWFSIKTSSCPETACFCRNTSCSKEVDAQSITSHLSLMETCNWLFTAINPNHLTFANTCTQSQIVTP